MAAVGVLQRAKGRIDTGVEDGDEVCRTRDLFEDAVEVLDDGRGAGEFVSANAEDYGEGRHEERGGGSFTGDVCDDDVDDVVGDLEEVVVVAAEKAGCLHGGGEFDAGDDGWLGQDLALDLRGEGEVALVIVALLADVGGHLAALRGDSGDEETDDQITGEADHVTKDSDVKGVGWRAEELLQEGAEHSESDGDGEAIDQAAERDGEEIEIAERVVLYDDTVGVGDGTDGDDDDEVEQSCGRGSLPQEGPACSPDCFFCFSSGPF